MININLELGINPKNILNNSCQLNEMDDVSMNNETDTNMSFCKSTNSDYSSNYIKPRDIKSSLQRIIIQEKNTINTKSKETEINEQIAKKVKYTISLHFQVVFVYFISIIGIMLFIFANIKNNSNLIDVAGVNGKWFYECKLENYDLGFDMFELIIFSILLIKCNQLSHYNEVFKYTKSISYSTKVGILLGPLLNIISYVVLSKQRYSKIIFDTLLNTSAYFIIFIIFIWKILYCIIQENGNNTQMYYILRRHNRCAIHNTMTCSCLLNISQEEYNINARRSIDIYKTCSSFFGIVDGKLVYINKDSKVKFVNEIL